MAQTPLAVGVDLGTTASKVVLGPRPPYNCEIVRNQVGGHTTPTSASFSNGARQIGEAASGRDAISHMMRLLKGVVEDVKEDDFGQFYTMNLTNAGADGSDFCKWKVETDYRNDESSDPTFMPPAAFIAMLLGNIQTNVDSTVSRISSETSPSDYAYALCVPPAFPSAALDELADAAAASDLNVTIVNSAFAYGSSFCRKFPDAGSKIVLVLDMGHSQTTAACLRTADGTQEESEESAQPRFQVLASDSNLALGAGSIDVRLWKHFQASMPALSSVKPASRSGQRLLAGCQKLKHLLSQLPEGSVTVENVGEQDADLKLSATRALLAELCQPEADALFKLISGVLENAKEANDGVLDIGSIEVLGGGCRIPFVQDKILEAIKPSGSATSLSRSLDDTTVALGAALLVDQSMEKAYLTTDEPSADRKAYREALREAEKSMAARDLDLATRDALRNKLEAYILEMRSSRHGKHGTLLPDDLGTYLDELDDWLFSDEANQASKDDMQAKLEAVYESMRNKCDAYFEAVENEKKAKELELEVEAKKAQAEREGQEDGDDKEDHDNRRLPKKRRMEIVLKNKSEANELFSDGNFKFAAARYTKALSHCAKFVDLAPDDVTEVNTVKLGLQLNLALAYIKLQNFDQALRVCDEAVALDDKSAKALYRRASVNYEKKRWDDAHRDIKKAASLAENDKAILKLKDRIEAQIKRQKAKEKKMAQKMFG